MKNENPENISPMEKQILAEELTAGMESEKPQKPKQIFKFNFVSFHQVLVSKFKKIIRPKPIAISLIILAIVLVFLAIVLISKDKPQQEDLATIKVTISSPQAVIDQEIENTKKEVSVFNDELESLDSELNSIKFPQIDLDINFD